MQVMIPMSSCIELGLVLNNMQAGLSTTATFTQVSVTGNQGGSGLLTLGEELAQDMAVRVYPNPATDALHVDVGSYMGRPARLEVFTVQGQVVQMLELDEVMESELTLDLSRLVTGIYGLRVKTPGLPDVVHRFVKAGL